MSAEPAKPVDPMTFYWDRHLSHLVQVEHTPMAEAEAERHTMLSLLVMALVFDAFNGNKHGANGTYPWREKQAISPGLYRGDPWGDRYLGHNIACIAVDAHGEIIDFEFNHNELFSSSAEHAEARLIRRIFNMTQANDHWQTIDPAQIVDVNYSTVLSGVTLYTSLESCAQCSGIMTLGNVNRVIYLQSDPGQYHIGNIMFNLSNPLPISHPLTMASAGDRRQ